jgi:hypothetical protein
LFNHGAGIGNLLLWYAARYKDATFIVTENGWGSVIVYGQDCALGFAIGFPDCWPEVIKRVVS